MESIRWLAAAFSTLLCTYVLAEDSKDPHAALGAPTVITSGNASVSWDTTVTTGSGNCDFRYSGVDNCFQQLWFFRAVGDTQETVFPNPDVINANGDALAASWADVGGRGLFSATATMRVVDTGNGSAEWRHALKLEPLGGAVDIRLFHYLDLDANASSGTDSGVLLHANDLIEVTDTLHVFHRGVGADRYRVAPFQGLRTELLDAAVTELGNSGAPFGPGDITSAYQWNHRLVPNYPVTFEVVLGLNRPALAQGSTVLNFDDSPRPDVFADALPADSEYAAQGISFFPVNGESMGFLDVSSFSTSGESPPNALAYNASSTFQNGSGVGTDAAFLLAAPAKRLEIRGNSSEFGTIWAGCIAPDRGLINARGDFRDASLDAESMILDGIAQSICVLSAPALSAGFFDDLAFTPVGRWVVGGANSVGCDTDETVFDVTFSNMIPALDFGFETIVKAGGLTYMHQIFVPGFENLDGPGTWGVFNTNSGGPTNGTFPIPAATPIEVVMTLRNPEGGVDAINRITLDRCDGGVVTSNVLLFDSIYEDGFYGYSGNDSQ